MQKTEGKLETVIEHLSTVKSLEFESPILSTADAIADQLIRKLKADTFRRKYRSDVGSALSRSVLHSNIRVVHELDSVRKSVEFEKNIFEKWLQDKVRVVEHFTDKYKQAQWDMKVCEKTLKKWEDLEKSQLNYMKIAIGETEDFYKKCGLLIKMIKQAQRVREVAMKFYQDYYLYIEYMEDVRDSYAGDIPFVKLKDFLENNYWKKEDFGAVYKKNVDIFLSVKQELKDIVKGPHEESKKLVKETKRYFILKQTEEVKLAKYEEILYRTRKFIEETISEKDMALASLDGLVATFMKLLPKRLFKNIDISRLQGKLDVVRYSFDVYTTMQKLLEERQRKGLIKV